MKTAIIAAALFFPSLTAAFYIGHDVGEKAGHEAGMNEGIEIGNAGVAGLVEFARIQGRIEAMRAPVMPTLFPASPD